MGCRATPRGFSLGRVTAEFGLRDPWRAASQAAGVVVWGQGPFPWALDQCPALSVIPSTPAEPCTLPGMGGPFPSPRRADSNRGAGGMVSHEGSQAGEAGEALSGSAPGAQPHSVRQAIRTGFPSRRVWGLTQPCFRLLSHLMPALWTLEDRRFPGLWHTAGSRRRVLSEPRP